VVGVVSDVKYAGLDKPDPGSVYWPMAGRGSRPVEEAATRFRYLLVRTDTDPAPVLSSIRGVLRELDASLPFSNVATIEELAERSLDRPRSLSWLVSGFAIVALVLSTVGIYGVMAHYVQQHSKEISIRAALGGSPADVLRLILSQGMKVVASGVVVGALAALLLTRLLSSLLFAVGAADTFTFLASAVLLLAVAMAACFVPAARAVGLEPASVLRNE
jgi:putative ABC transport system permease protein